MEKIFSVHGAGKFVAARNFPRESFIGLGQLVSDESTIKVFTEDGEYVGTIPLLYHAVATEMMERGTHRVELFVKNFVVRAVPLRGSYVRHVQGKNGERKELKLTPVG